MSFGVLFLAAICKGATTGTGVSADKVAVGANGILQSLEVTPSLFVLEKDQPLTPADGTPFEVDHSLDGNADTPFEMDPVAEKITAASAVQDATTNDSPFVSDPKGAAPPAPPPRPRMEDLPYRFEGEPKQVLTTAAGAALTGDSPFVIEGAAKPAASHAAPAANLPFEMDSTAAAALPRTAPVASSPFVMDAQMKAGTSQASPALAKTVSAKAKPQSKGTTTFTIVKNSDPHPGVMPVWAGAPTTRMVVRLPEQMATSTAGPTTTSDLSFQFELGESMIEVSAGQMFVPIPSTPFEMERGLAWKLGRPSKVGGQRNAIELLRPGLESSAPLRPASLIAEEAELRAVREVGVVSPHVTRRLVRSEDALTDGHPEVPSSTAAVITGQIQDAKLTSVEAAATGQDDSVLGNTSVLPITVQSIATPRVTQPATPGAKGSDPSVPLATAQSNDTVEPQPLSAPASIFNATAEDLPINVSNITARLPRVVTVRGAAISIFLGGAVTVFFFSMLLCILNAGKTEKEKGEQQKEAPRQTRTYRQLLASQTSSTATLPSV